MSRSALICFCLFLACPPAPAQQTKSFRDQQLTYPRVRLAAKEKDEVLRSMLAEKNLPYPPPAILLRAFKKEALLELWAACSSDAALTLVHTYGICATSGILGPKRKFGDVQVPEGFYELDWFNPQSNFFLSLHVNYPNASDRVLGSHSNPGGDIFLHGNCVTIGCIPITDDGIKEVYWLAVQVHDRGQRHLPIEIFPARLTDEGFRALAHDHPNEPNLLSFWDNLREGYQRFEKDHRPLQVGVTRDGKYTFAEVGAHGQ